MKKFFVLFMLLFTLTLSAQSSDFDKAFDACVKINTGFAGGIPDGGQLSIAAETLKSMKIGSLNPTLVHGEQPTLNGHIYFSADFINRCIQEKKIFGMAKEYAKRSGKRGLGANQVLMTTVVIPAGQTHTYEISGCTDEVNLGCVAETTGLFSWKVKTTEYKSKAETSFPDNIDAKKGRSSRRMTVKSPNRYKITLEITNTSNHDSSFAILAK